MHRVGACIIPAPMRAFSALVAARPQVVILLVKQFVTVRARLAIIHPPLIHLPLLPWMMLPLWPFSALVARPREVASLSRATLSDTDRATM